ncbi:shikimate kinase [Ningiella sp. W23]|uniref:shikimate kinase n=1 Tax=Ningiella sp. W23 TaxID=3023715 RepID=UPI003756E9B6
MSTQNKRILVFGNSGSGKSTLAKQLASKHALAHMDLDTIAWLPGEPPTRQSIGDSHNAISEFTLAHDDWVIEGCYADLLSLLLDKANELIFMNLPVEQCIENAIRRPWEPHKYASKQAQDANLEMLCDWIAQYPNRDDVLSLNAHKRLYNEFEGKKHVLTFNDAYSD